MFVDAQFLNQPLAETRQVFAGDRANFTCSVTEGLVIDWKVTFPYDIMMPRYAAHPYDSTVLGQRDVVFDGVGTSMSQLSVGGNLEGQSNSGIRIVCVAQGGLTPNFGNEIEVIFLGKLVVTSLAKLMLLLSIGCWLKFGSIEASVLLFFFFFLLFWQFRFL